MEQQKDTAQPSGLPVASAVIETTASKKPYIAPHLELLDIEATRNGAGTTTDGSANFS